MVAAGTIQTPEDVDGLEVSIRIDVSRITMHSGDMDLGSWPSGAVTITRIDDARFAFVAEGDRLLFSPADVDAFAAHPGVLDDTAACASSPNDAAANSAIGLMGTPFPPITS